MKSYNRFNKNVYPLLIVVVSAMLNTGCKKTFLDVPTPNSIPATEFWVTGDDATLGVNAMYANLRSWTEVAFAPIALESIGSDDTETGSDASDGSVPFMNTYDNFTVTSTQGQISDFWNGRYQEINLCNKVLDNIPNIDMDPTLKSRYLAEAKFVRAYEYFRLVRAFGDVPLRLKSPADASGYNIPKSPKAEVWAAIEQDLTDAAAVLPPVYTGADVGRATKGAANALHAKVAMYQSKWADVKTYTELVMAGPYSLFANYEQLFRVANENCSESVFEIQAALIIGNSDASNCQYSQVQGTRGTVGGWGFNVPTANLVAEYEAGDPRKDATIIFRGETTPEGDAIPSTTPNPMYNQKSYVPFNDIVSGYTEGSQQNIRVIRYAEVLLMNAEANNELGATGPALTSLNAVRARARAGAVGILPDVTTTDQGQLRTAIYHERRVELAMEFDRYFDVIRQGRAAAVFGPLGWTANKNEVWPIPQSEIDLSSGTITQNPNY